MGKPDHPNGFKRDKDGVLIWVSGMGVSYKDPGEAVRFYDGGNLKPGCNARLFGLLSSHGCRKTPKHDPDANGRPTKCGNHCKAALERREAKKDATTARWKRQWAADHAVSDAERAIEATLRAIAAGHNDPRAAATEVIEKLDAARAEARAAYQK